MSRFGLGYEDLRQLRPGLVMTSFSGFGAAGPLADQKANGASIEAMAGWDVLHPAPTDRFTTADDNAVVLRGTLGGVRVLLLSDLGRQGQRALLERTADLGADLVVAGLPREGEPLGPALLERINPQLIVVASAEYPAPERVKPATRERLRATGKTVLFAEELGTIQLWATEAGVRIQSIDGRMWDIPPRQPNVP
jgi:beta-lactamase superfamily II metal-dependent hydrolase